MCDLAEALKLSLSRRKQCGLRMTPDVTVLGYDGGRSESISIAEIAMSREQTKRADPQYQPLYVTLIPDQAAPCNPARARRSQASRYIAMGTCKKQFFSTLFNSTMHEPVFIFPWCFPCSDDYSCGLYIYRRVHEYHSSV